MADNVTFQAAAPATPPDGTVVAADDVGGALYQRFKLDVGADGVSSPVTSIASETTQAANGVLLGGVTETAPATDTASSGLNGRLQRIAQRLTSLIALLPAALGAGGGLKVDGSGTALPVSGTVTSNLGTLNGAALDATLSGRLGEVQASPTANTVLDRLKALLTGISLAAGSAIVGKVGIDQTTPGTTNGVQLPAGELHIGEVGTPTAYLSSTPTLTVASGYISGDYVGPSTAPASFANAARVSGGKLVIKSLTINDKTATAAVAMELWLFSATVTVPADSAAWTISDADNLLCVGVIPITTDKWYASAANKTYSDDSISKVVKCAATSLFYALVPRGTPPAWADGDLTLSIGVLQA